MLLIMWWSCAGYSRSSEVSLCYHSEIRFKPESSYQRVCICRDGTSGSRFTIWVEFGRFWTEVLPVWCLYGPREGPTSSLPSCMSVLSIASNQVSLFREAVKMPLWAKGVLKQNYLRYYFKRCSCLCHHCIGVGLVFVFFSAKLFLGKVLSRMVWRA